MAETQNAPAETQKKARRVYVDAMKGLGIILVVWGHFEEYYRGSSPIFNGSFECVYLFHMALFCLCSGLVAKFNVFKLIFQQIWLYLLCQGGLLLFRQYVLTEDLAAAGDTMQLLITPWRHMWYLYALIFWELTVPLLALLRDKLWIPGRILGLAAAVALGLWAGGMEWKYSLNRVFCFFPFFAAGVLFRKEIDCWFRAAMKFIPLRILSGAAFLGIYGYWMNLILKAPEPVYENARIFNDVAYNEGYTMEDRAYFYLIGILTSLVLIAFLGNIKTLASLGKRTLPVYIMHMPVYAFLVELGTYGIAGEKEVAAVAGWVFLAAGGTVCLFGSAPIAGLFNLVANIWYKLLPAGVLAIWRAIRSRLDKRKADHPAAG